MAFLVEGLESLRHRTGGGRKSAFETIDNLDAVFLRVLTEHSGGLPMDATVKWTNLTRQESATLLHDMVITVRVAVVDQLLEKYHFRACRPDSS